MMERALVALWSCNTAPGFPNSGISSIDPRARVAFLWQALAATDQLRKNRWLSGDIQHYPLSCIFVAPEYLFAGKRLYDSAPRTLPLTQDPSNATAFSSKQTLTAILSEIDRAIQALPGNTLVIPGTFYITKAISGTSKSGPALQKRQKLLNDLNNTGRDLIGGFYVDSLGRTHRVPDQNYKLAFLQSAWGNFFQRNSAYVYYNKARVFHYRKRSDFHEAIGEQNKIFLPACKPGIFQIAGRIFGIEICLDHGFGVLKSTVLQQWPLGLDIQIVTSAAIQPYQNQMAMKRGGYSIHASSDDSCTGVWQRNANDSIVPLPELPNTRTQVGGGPLRFWEIRI